MDEDFLFSLRDSLIVVTGAMGRLGRHYVAALSYRGAKIAAIDTAAAIARAEDIPANTKAYAADVTVKAELEAALVTIARDFGRVPDGLVNNAALDSPPDSPPSENGPFETYPEESWDKVMQVNVKGVFLCSQVFGGAMSLEGKGSIVNVGSIYGKVSPDQDVYDFRRKRGENFFKPVAYSASKSAIYNLTRYLAVYWSKKGVRVNTLTLAGVYDGQEQAFLDAYCPRVTMARMASPADYIGPLVFLLSGASSYMTGSDLVVDGGWTAK